MSQRVFVAMSGGVDSSVSAYVLKKAGYDVAGINLRLYPNPEGGIEKSSVDLERTCHILNIPLYYLNLETEFKDSVIEPFCHEYESGHTPNPCVQCNRKIKFGRLFEKIRELGGDYLATGHYARIQKSAGIFLLKKAVDVSKDQSYFLYVLRQKELANILFPIGGMMKTEVKQIAEKLGLPAAGRQESQDICFIPHNDIRAFLASRLNSRPGEIVNTQGKILGMHKGLAFYTVGQRQGMGVAANQALYVLKIDTATNRLIVGFKSQLYRDSLIAGCLTWISGTQPESGLGVSARVRYRARDAKAVLLLKQNKVFVQFAEPQWAITPGQSVVFYQGDFVLGGGLIE